MPKPDTKAFNTDPKHAEDREAFDAMVEESAKRIAEKRKASNPPAPKDENVWDSMFGGLFK